MIIMKVGTPKRNVQAVIDRISSLGLRSDLSEGETRIAIGIIGDESRVDFGQIRAMKGVIDAIRIQAPYRLMGREYIPEDVVFNVGDVSIGGDSILYIAGPCSIENYDQIARIGDGVKEAGAHILRGGAFKPRTSAHAFQGNGEAALKALARVGKELGLPTITEVRSESHVELVAEHADILQIGARNWQNQDLIEAVARTGKPVFYKRGPEAQIQEFLGFAERIVIEGNKEIILCERGIMPIGGPFHSITRNTLDLSAVPVLKAETPFPVVVDPSHATGRRDLIHPMSMAAIAAGAHGLMIEVHDRPEEALSDGAQSIHPRDLARLIRDGNALHNLMRSFQS